MRQMTKLNWKQLKLQQTTFEKIFASREANIQSNSACYEGPRTTHCALSTNSGWQYANFQIFKITDLL